MSRPFAVVLWLALVALPGLAAAQDTIRVHVMAAGEDAGFTSKGADDSVADLAKALGRKRRLMVVPSRSGADVVIRVESRDSHWETGGAYSYRDSKGRTQVYSAIRKEKVVYATLHVEDYSHQLHGEGATWRQASDRVANDVDKWIQQNRRQLLERRER